MNIDTSRLRLLIRQAEESRQDHVQAILQERGPLRCGSVVRVQRKCGKPTCHCATGDGHHTTYLSCKHDGKTRMVYVPAEVEPKVTEEALRYRRLRQHRARLAKLSAQSLGLIDQLQRALLSSDPVKSLDASTATGGRARPPQGR